MGGAGGRDSRVIEPAFLSCSYFAGSNRLKLLRIHSHQHREADAVGFSSLLKLAHPTEPEMNLC